MKKFPDMASFFLAASCAIAVLGCAMDAVPAGGQDAGMVGTDQRDASDPGAGDGGHRMDAAIMLKFSAMSQAIEGLPAAAIATADCNKDGTVDLFLTKWAVLERGTVATLLNDGSRRFHPGFKFAYNQYPGSVVAGDWDHDGFGDFLTNPGGADGVSFSWFGDAQGGLAVRQVPMLTADSGIVAADFDGDGLTDLALNGAGGIQVFAAQPDRQFRLLATLAPPSAGSRAITVGDLDHDGRADLVAAAMDPLGSKVAGILVIRRTDAGSFGTPAFSALPPSTTSPPMALAVADFDGDGVADVTDGHLLMSGQQGGSLGAASVFFGSEGSSRWLCAGDFDLDGVYDLVLPGAADNGAVLWRGGKKGQAIRGPELLQDRVSGCAVADFDGDGKLDIALAPARQSAIWFLFNDSI